MESLDLLLNKKNKTKSNVPRALKRCAGYIRVSTEEQTLNPEGSIKNQEERIKQALSFKNSTEEFGALAHVFIDPGLSGKDMNRPELRRMLKLVAEGEIDLIMVSDLSRLSRSIRDFSQIWEFLQVHHCQLWSLRENFDTSTAAGEMMLYSIANFSQYERKQTGERVAANFQARASRGLHNGGTIPLGYEIDPEKPGHFRIHEKNSETVKTAFLALLKEGSIAGAARFLNENAYTFNIPYAKGGGASQPRSKAFNVSNLTYLLSNPAYIGIRRYKQKNGKYQEAKAAWPAIIDETTFQMAKTVISNSRGRKLPSGNRYPYLLTGKVICLECGQTLCGKSAHGTSGKVTYYEHSHQQKKEAYIPESERKKKCEPFRVQAKILEKRVWDEIESLVKNPNLSQALFKKLEKRNEHHENKSLIEKLADDLKKTDLKIEGLLSRLAELPKNIPAITFYQEIERLQHERATTEEKRNALLKTNLDSEKVIKPTDYEQFLVRLIKLVMENPSFETRKAIINALIHQVEITKDGFKMGFYVGAGQIKKGELLASPSFSLKNNFLSDSSFLLKNGALDPL